MTESWQVNACRFESYVSLYWYCHSVTCAEAVPLLCGHTVWLQVVCNSEIQAFKWKYRKAPKEAVGGTVKNGPNR